MKEIIAKLGEVEKMHANGLTIEEAWKVSEITDQIFFRGWELNGELTVDELKRLKGLKYENTKL